MNSVMLAALIARDGGIADVSAPCPTTATGSAGRSPRAGRRPTPLLISGGSSTGPEDHAPGLVAELGDLPVHGVALRPASPTGLGFDRRRPGRPLAGQSRQLPLRLRLLRRPDRPSAGRPPDRLAASRGIAPLARKLASVVGRVDYARVRIDGGRVEPLAVSGASILSSTTRADGFVVVPADLEGYPAGAAVTVRLYDETSNHEPFTG